jgi:DNA polymerase-3 subunit alpha
VSLGEIQIPEGGRAGATIAALIYDVRWRTSARGNRYLMATLSDTSGLSQVSCFDEMVAKDMEDVAREGGCAMITVELDKRAGDETPRVAVKRVQSFESIAGVTRLVLDLEIVDPGVLTSLARLIGGERGGRCLVQVRVPSRPGEQATLVLGRDFRIDEEMVARVRALPGVVSAQLGSAAAELAAAA